MPIDSQARGLAATANNKANALILAAPKPFPKWSAAKSRVRLGTGRGSMACIGTSITAGTNSADSLPITGSWPYKLAARFAANGLYTCTDSVWCSHGSAITFDPRLSGSNWGQSLSNTSLGGPMLNCATADRLTFTPVANCDRAAIRWLVYNGAPCDIDVYVDGVFSTTLECSGTAAIGEQTINLGSVGAHTVGLQRNGASGTVYVQSIRTWSTATPAIDVYNMGWQSSQSSDWIVSSNVTKPLPQMSAISADLYVIGMDRNDCNATVNLDTYKSNLTLMVTTCKSAGDVVLFAEPPESTGVASAVKQNSYVDVVKQVALEQGVTFIDFQSLWVSYAVSNAYSLYSDTIHPSALGYDAMDQPFYTPLGS